MTFGIVIAQASWLEAFALDYIGVSLYGFLNSFISIWWKWESILQAAAKGCNPINKHIFLNLHNWHIGRAPLCMIHNSVAQSNLSLFPTPCQVAQLQEQWIGVVQGGSCIVDFAMSTALKELIRMKLVTHDTEQDTICVVPMDVAMQTLSIRKYLEDAAKMRYLAGGRASKLNWTQPPVSVKRQLKKVSWIKDGILCRTYPNLNHCFRTGLCSPLQRCWQACYHTVDVNPCIEG